MHLEDIGYTPAVAAHFELLQQQELSAARVCFESKNSYRVLTERGEMPAVVAGKLHHAAETRIDLPVVGDWVTARLLDEMPARAVIVEIVPRSSVFARKEAGARTAGQPVAANVDTVFVVTGLDGNFSVRRIERYLTLAWESGSVPVVLLTKADLCADPDARVAEAAAVAVGADVHAVSVSAGTGLANLDCYLLPGRTIALLGSSGVGKSTLVNHLLGQDAQKTRTVRLVDSKGRHATTHRQMFILPSGTLMIDTPGMRELQLWTADEGLAGAFGDIEAIARRCRFADCRHLSEPGCAVSDAVAAGELDADRLESYLRLQRELEHLALKQDAGAAAAERRKWKPIMKEIRRMYKQR